MMLMTKKMVTLHSYNGRELEGFIFLNNSPPSLNLVPSSRYLGVLVKGAKQAGLDPNYIEKLSIHPTYKPNVAVLKARKQRPKPEELNEITVEQLSKNENWISCLGYVFEPVRIFFDSHRGMYRISIGIFEEWNSDKEFRWLRNSFRLLQEFLCSPGII